MDSNLENLIKNNRDIPKNFVELKDVFGDGNCYFRVLSLYYKDDQNNYHISYFLKLHQFVIHHHEKMKQIHFYFSLRFHKLFAEIFDNCQIRDRTSRAPRKPDIGKVELLDILQVIFDTVSLQFR